jgi:hypothetical protein
LNAASFRLKPCPEGFDIFFFDAGRMYRVFEAEGNAAER